MNLFDRVLNLVDRFVSNVGRSIENIAKDPLPTIASVALQQVGVPAWVTQTAIGAVRGASMEDMVLNLAKGYAASQVGTYVGEQFYPSQGVDVTGGLETAVPYELNQELFKSILVQSSTQAAKAALDGKSFDQILQSATTGAITGAVSEGIRTQLGLNPNELDGKILTGAVSSATRALLGGRSVEDAVANSIAQTALGSTVGNLTSGIKSALKSYETASDNYANLQKEAQELYDQELKYVMPRIQEGYNQINAQIAQANQYKTDLDSNVPAFNQLLAISQAPKSGESEQNFYNVLQTAFGFDLKTDPNTGKDYAFIARPDGSEYKVAYQDQTHADFLDGLYRDLNYKINDINNLPNFIDQLESKISYMESGIADELQIFNLLQDQLKNYDDQIVDIEKLLNISTQQLNDVLPEYSKLVQETLDKYSGDIADNAIDVLNSVNAEKTQLEAADELDKSYADPSEVRATLAKLGLDSFSNSRLIDQFIGKSEVGLEDIIKETLDPYILDQSELQALAEEEGYKGNVSQFQAQFLDSTQLEDWEDYVRNQFDKQSLTKDEAILKFHNAGIFDQKYIDENLDQVMSGASKLGYESAADDVVKQLKSDLFQKEQIAKQEQEQEALQQQALLKQNPSTIDDVRAAQSTQPSWLFNSKIYNENKFVGIPKDQLTQAFYDNYRNNTSTYEQVIDGLKSRGWSERGAENAFNAFSRAEGWNYGTVGPALLAQKLDAFTDRVNLTPDEVKKIANDVGYDIPESEIANYVYKNDVLSASYFNLADSVKQQLDAKSVIPDEVIEYFEKQGIKDPKYIQENLPKYVGNRDEASLPLTLKNDYSAYQTQQNTEDRLASVVDDNLKHGYLTLDEREPEIIRTLDTSGETKPYPTEESTIKQEPVYPDFTTSPIEITPLPDLESEKYRDQFGDYYSEVEGGPPISFTPDTSDVAEPYPTEEPVIKQEPVYPDFTTPPLDTTPLAEPELPVIEPGEREPIAAVEDTDIPGTTFTPDPRLPEIVFGEQPSQPEDFGYQPEPPVVEPEPTGPSGGVWGEEPEYFTDDEGNTLIVNPDGSIQLLGPDGEDMMPSTGDYDLGDILGPEHPVEELQPEAFPEEEEDPTTGLPGIKLPPGTIPGGVQPPPTPPKKPVTPPAEKPGTQPIFPPGVPPLSPTGGAPNLTGAAPSLLSLLQGLQSQNIYQQLLQPRFETFYMNIPGYEGFDINEMFPSVYEEE